MHDNLAVLGRGTYQPRGAHMESGRRSELKCCTNRDEPHCAGRAKPPRLRPTDCISLWSGGQGSEWQAGFTHLDIANSNRPQSSRDSGQIRGICDFLMTEQLRPRAGRGVGKILHRTLANAVPAGR